MQHELEARMAVGYGVCMRAAIHAKAVMHGKAAMSASRKRLQAAIHGPGVLATSKSEMVLPNI